MHAHQHRTAGGDVALDQRHMLGRIDGGGIDLDVERPAMGALHLGLGHDFDQMVVAQPVGDQVGNGGDLQPMTLGEGDEIGQPGHGAVVVHDLADDAGGVETGQPREIDGGLGMAGAHQHAAFLGDQREHVAWSHDVAIILGRIDGDGDGVGAVMSGDAGRDPFPRLDRHGEGGRVPRPVGARHQLEMELLGPLGRERQTDQPAAVLGHEVDGVGRRHLGRDDEVALVLALLGIDQDEHAAVARILDHLLDRRQELVVVGFGHDGHGASPSCCLRRAT